MSQANPDLVQNYAGAFDGRLAFGARPALLIVDFVMAYLDPASRFTRALKTRWPAMSGFWRRPGLPIFP